MRRRVGDKNIRNKFLLRPRPPSVVTQEEGINSGDVITLIAPYISFISQDGGEGDCSWFLRLTFDFHFTSRHLPGLCRYVASLKQSHKTIFYRFHADMHRIMVPPKLQNSKFYLWQLAYSLRLCARHAPDPKRNLSQRKVRRGLPSPCC